MFIAKNFFVVALTAISIVSCTKTNEVTQVQPIQTNSRSSAKQTTISLNEGGKAKDKYVKSLEKFKNKMRLKTPVLSNGRYAEPIEDVAGDENIISYTTGTYIGDPYDDVIAADGPIIQAVSQQEEEETRLLVMEQISEAKVYLNSHGLDLSDEYTYDDPRYIHAANIILEMENRKGIPSGGGDISVSRENTTVGCILQATGINTLYESWFNKFATKRMLIAAVGKLATRYLGWVGAAVAVYDFVDCMWG